MRRRRCWRWRLNAQDDAVRVVSNSEIGATKTDKRALREGAGDPALALNDGELLSGLGSEAVNERAAQGSYTSPEINAFQSTCSRSYSVPGVHAADFDLESRPRVKDHVAGGSQQAGAVPWRHGSIGRGDTADWAGAAKRSTGNIHQTAGSVTVYQQGPGANRRGAGVGIRGVAESEYAGATFHHSANAAHLSGPGRTDSSANIGADASSGQDSVDKSCIPVSENGLLIVELSSGDQIMAPRPNQH